MDPIVFSAIIAPIQSAFQTGSDGARLKLDIPESDMPQALTLVALGRNKNLRVTIEVEE